MPAILAADSTVEDFYDSSFIHSFISPGLTETLLCVRPWAEGCGHITERNGQNPRLWADSAQVNKQHHFRPWYRLRRDTAGRCGGEQPESASLRSSCDLNEGSSKGRGFKEQKSSHCGRNRVREGGSEKEGGGGSFRVSEAGGI